MFKLAVCALCVTISSLAFSQTPKQLEQRLIFEDDFERQESDDSKEEVGKGWTTNSSSRAGGHKQVDLRDGTLHIKMHSSADHAVSVKHDAEFQDGVLELKFMLEHPRDILGLDFADLQLKTVHAGHLFKVDIGTNKLTLTDLKTGNMDLKHRELRLAKQVTPELKQLLASKQKSFPLKLDTGHWYALRVSIVGDNLQVAIDGRLIGEFASPGFAHPTKRALRVAVPHEAVIDDLKIFGLTSPTNSRG